MALVRYAELAAEPWPGGSGVTRVLAREGTDWRISIAEVSQPGPFSALPGIDRVITLVDGEFLMLLVGGVQHGLERFRPFRFSGDADTRAELPTGAALALNVMTRREKFRAFVTVIELSRKHSQPVFDDQWAVLLQGAATLADGSTLQRFDAVSGAEPSPGTGTTEGTTPELTGRGFLALISLEPLPS